MKIHKPTGLGNVISAFPILEDVYHTFTFPWCTHAEYCDSFQEVYLASD